MIAGIVINEKEVHSFEVVKYEVLNGNINISMIKALDKEGKYIKFVKLEKVLPYLSQFKVEFKPICNE
jgi:hypothetical protein